MLILAAILAIFVYGMIAAMLGTILPGLSERFHLTPRQNGTAIGFANTCGWIGLAVSSRLIGAIAGGDPKRLRKALLVIPAFAVVMIALNLMIQSMLH